MANLPKIYTHRQPFLSLYNPQMTNSTLQNNPTTFTPKFSDSLVARFPALKQSKTSNPRQNESQHKLLKRVAKPLAPQSKTPPKRVHVPHSNKYLRRPVKHTFSGRVHDLNVAKIIQTSLRKGSSHEDRLSEFASKQQEFREYMNSKMDTSDHSRSVSPVSVADSLASISSEASSPNIEK